MCLSQGRGEAVAMGVIRSVFFSALALALAACATEEGLYLNFVNKECVAETAKKQIRVDWNQAKVINFAIRDGAYDSDITHMKVGQPTILRITNNDNTRAPAARDELMDRVIGLRSLGHATSGWIQRRA